MSGLVGRKGTRCVALCSSLLAAFCGASSVAAAEQVALPSQVIVKLRSDGPNALRECAEWLTRSGRPLASASAAGSDSLDRVHRSLKVRRLRALFRRADGTPLAQQRAALRARHGATRDLAHVYLVDLPPSASVGRAVAAYAADPHVEYAQPNFLVQADAFVPDDPFFASSGAWGQGYRDLWGLLSIDAPGAWEHSLGEGIVVAVVDTGLDYAHEDIAENVWVNPGEDLNGNGRYDASDLNGVDDDGNGFVDDVRGFDFHNSLDADGDERFDGAEDVSDNDPFDDNGHGTHVSGTIAAAGGNALGIVGVAPRARILPAKALGASGSGNIAALSQAIVYAARQGAHVINNSWSCGGSCVSNPVAEDAVRLAEELDAVLVFSAGNKQSDVAFISPQNRPETLAVAALTQEDTPTGFTSGGLLVDVTAPGGGTDEPADVPAPVFNILSLRSSAVDPESVLNVAQEYLRLAGTSMSAPHVAGVVALVRAAHPSLRADEVRLLLRLTADDLGSAGHDATHGAGRVNAARAVARGSVPDIRVRISSPEPVEVFSQAELEVQVSGTAAGSDLVLHELAFGAGLEPETWQPLGTPATTPVEDGTLGSWDVEELEDGFQVLRLRGEASAGERLEAFMPVAFERNRPRIVSSPGAAARPEDISGDLLLWSSARPGDEELPEGEPLTSNLFLTNLADGSEHAIRVSPGRIVGAALSGRRVAWLESTPGTSRAFTCRFEPVRGLCPATPLPTTVRSPPVVSGNRLVWVDSRDGSDLYTCVVDRHTGECPEVALVTHPALQYASHLDGQMLVWSDFRRGSLEIFYCEIDAQSGACPERPVELNTTFPFFPRISGDLLAFRDFTGLRICELDLETGACPAITIAGASALQFDLSDDRLVWPQVTPEGVYVFFCEYDRVTRTCPVQRITGVSAPQLQPLTDAEHVAWSDPRNGAAAVAVFDLPQVAPLRNREIRAGRVLAMPVRGRDPTFDRVSLRASLADGRPLSTIGADFHDRGKGFGLFFWRTTTQHLGQHFLRFTAESGGRLLSDETVRVDVHPRGRPGRR